MFKNIGKNSAFKIINRYAKLRKHKALSNIRLPYKKSNVLIDNIYIGYFGILVVGNIGFEGELYGNEKDSKWALYEKEGKTPIENQLLKLQQQVDAIRDIFIKEEIYKVDIKSCLVIWKSEKKLKSFVNCDYIFRLNEFKRYITRSQFEQDKGIDIDKIISAFEKYRVQD